MTTATRSSSVRSAAWNAHRRRVLPELRARADGVCERCGEPFDPDARPRSSLAESVDHVVPLAQGGELVVPASELRLVHVKCNSARANRMRGRPAARVTITPAVELPTELERPRAVAYPIAPRRRDKKRDELDATPLFDADSLSAFVTRPPSGRNLSLPPSKTGDAAESGNGAGEAVEFVPPRLETPRPSRVVGSYGAEAAAWIREYLDDELRPWQRYALVRILEHDEHGALVWRRVIVTVSRQSGKSTLARGLCAWRLGAADVFGEAQDVLHVANLRDTARKIWRPAARRLEASIGAVVRRANGQEAIELGLDGELGSWRLAAATLDGGVGDSNALAFCDEGWRLAREVVDGSIGPTLAERNSSQLVLASSAGHGGSKLLAEDRAQAIGELGDPDSATILLLEWSAAPERGEDDREGWREASPHYTARREAFLEQQFKISQQVTGDPTEDAKRRRVWTMQYLNRWVEGVSTWISAGAWDAGARTELELPATPAGTVAIEHHVAGYPFGAVFAVADAAGDVRLVARTFEKRRDLWTWLEELAGDRRGLETLYPPSLKGHVPAALRRRSAQVGTAEQYAGYGPTVGAALEGRLLHDGGLELREHVLRAATARVPDRGTTLSSKHSPGPIYLARAMVWAVAHELRPDARTKPLVAGSARRTAA